MFLPWRRTACSFVPLGFGICLHHHHQQRDNQVCPWRVCGDPEISRRSAQHRRPHHGGAFHYLSSTHQRAVSGSMIYICHCKSKDFVMVQCCECFESDVLPYSSDFEVQFRHTPVLWTRRVHHTRVFRALWDTNVAILRRYEHFENRSWSYSIALNSYCCNRGMLKSKVLY